MSFLRNKKSPVSARYGAMAKQKNKPKAMRTKPIKNTEKISILKVYVRVKCYGYTRKEGVIKFSLRANGYASFEYSTGIKVEVSRFDARTLEVKDEPTKTIAIRDLRHKFEAAFYELHHKEAKFTLRELPSFAIKGYHKSPDLPSLKAFVAKCVKAIKEKEGVSLTKHTVNKYTHFETVLSNYLSEIHGVADLELTAVTKGDAQRLYDYCRQRYGHHHNTAARVVAIFKRMLEVAADDELLERNPFSNYSQRRQRTPKFALTLEQVQTIAQTPLIDDTGKAIRDKFVFACFTGLSHGDLDELNERDFVNHPNGQRSIQKGRNKNGQRFLVPILPPAEAILSRYPASVSGRIFPLFAHQHENRVIKGITAICGIPKPVTFKDARSTFGSMLHALGVPTSAIQIAMGHENPSTTEQYYLTKQTDTVFTNFANAFKHFTPPQDENL
jgi:integrase